eukprot:TRINITY_DN25263_c0_g2_i1.p2 TRINITY_DN25263_c0_g2~~TRINITY_DN25263_c0_g2_i1.p2  ORF type:complete len:194 (+),score=64.06 TRINITY_DN25263_c0_g2_i1:201-782(+)
MMDDDDPAPSPDLETSQQSPKKLDSNAVQWRIEHIRQQRQQLWERRQAKLEATKAKSELMSKNALMAGGKQEVAPAPSGIRLRNELEEDAEYEEGERRVPADVWWSPDKGVHRTGSLENPKQRAPAQSQRTAGSDWKDKYLMYPTIFMSVVSCLLYTSDAADEEDSVDLGGRRIIKKKKKRRESKGTSNQVEN